MIQQAQVRLNHSVHQHQKVNLGQQAHQVVTPQVHQQAQVNQRVLQHLTVHTNQQAHQKVIQQVKVRHYQKVHQSQQAEVNQVVQVNH